MRSNRIVHSAWRKVQLKTGNRQWKKDNDVFVSVVSVCRGAIHCVLEGWGFE
jgi:hypothetical protein